MTAPAPESLVLGSNVVALLPGVAGQERADILDALLWAEFSASSAHDRQTQWEAWITSYGKNLLGSGFTFSGELAQQPVKVSNEKRFRREATRLVRTIRQPQLASVAASALDTLFNSAHARVFFSDWFAFDTGRSDSFQVVPCERAESGQISIAVCGLQMLTRTRIKLPQHSILQWPLAYEMTLTLRGGGFVYQRDAYQPHRDRVRQALSAWVVQGLQGIALSS